MDKTRDVSKLDLDARRLLLVATDKTFSGFMSKWVKDHFVPVLLDDPFFILNRNSTQRAVERLLIPPFPHISPSEARNLFQFEVGHPRDNTIYVLDPFEPSSYLVPATADETLAKRKVSAFMAAMSTLGAKELRIETALVTDLGGGLDVGTRIPLEIIAVQLGLRVNVDTQGNVSKEVIAAYDKPSHPPHVAPEVKKLFQDDPISIAFFDSRINGSIRKMRAELSIKRSSGLSANLLEAFGAMSINIGGRMSFLVESKWFFDVEFWPK